MRTRMVLIAATIGAVLVTAASAVLLPPPGAQIQAARQTGWATTAYTWAQPWGWSPAPAHAQPPASVFR